MNWRRLVMVIVACTAWAPPGRAQQRPPAQPAAAKVLASGTITSPHGADLRVPCATCHRSDGWKPARISPDFRHAERTFPLNGAHERAQCQSCHKQLDFKRAPTSCATCHEDPHKNEFGATCARCHNTRTFVDRGTAMRTHQATRFPLRGAHAIAACEACHANTRPGQAQFAARGTTCEACHLPTFRATTSPAHEAAHFSHDCTSCHTISSWGGASFDHNTTRFPLTGRHATATCQGCHRDNVFTGRSTTCVSCHQADFAAAREPRHDQGFPTACESCHGTSQWKGALFDHATTPFALTGAHRAVSCAGCHADGIYRGKPTDCASCHQAKAVATTNPPHVAARFANTCETCHTTTTWTGGKYDHAQTRFPLTGAHAAVTCMTCHADKVFVGKPMVCASCHQRDFDGSTQPNHRTLGFPSTCETCHGVVKWQGGTFDHTANTRFVLTGAHRALSCQTCHGDGVYRGKPMTCVGCHQATYDATTSPYHAPAKFATTCETCHTTDKWLGAPYDHSKTLFPLLGKHVSATCLACHSDRVYVGKPSVCVSCHQRDFDASLQPNHKTNGIPTVCESCHNAAGWKPATFDHATTNFPLTGAHRAVNCAGCHADGVYRGKPTACVSCHQAKFDATKTPDHKASGFPTTCLTCHNVTAWTPATFDHAATSFPLTGGHRTVPCAQCHADNVFKGKPTACASCHQAKFDVTTNPHHAPAGFATACETCHTTASWLGAPFDHTKTQFALLGKHLTATCLACHSDRVYKGKPSVCVACHQTNYDASSKPNHRTSGFPTTCESCHNAAGWTPASFDHNTTAFPLVGAHRAVSCLGCHGDGVYKGKPSSCVNCHQAKYDATTAPNHRTSLFPTTCQTCHTATAWTPATFDHATTKFPLTGAHRTTTCAGCHADGVYAGKPTTCSSCHIADYNGSTNPNHKTALFPQTCESCHTTTQWTGATFNHDGPWFPIYSGSHRAKWNSCTQCHTNNANYAEYTCLSCHLKPKMDSEHNGRNGYRYESSACYACHPRGNS